MLSVLEPITLPLSASHRDDLCWANSQLTGAKRRAFQAAMAVNYCGGNARHAERVFGWGRETVQLGLHEQRTGIVCVGAQAAFSGHRLWEDQHPQIADALWRLAEAHSQQDPTFRTPLAYTRLTAAEALAQLRAQGFADAGLPAPSTMAAVLNRNGYRLRKVIKAKPQKKIPETDAIFANLAEWDGQPLAERDPDAEGPVKRLSLDCKATVKIGDYARGGKTRGDHRAADHDMGGEEKYIPRTYALTSIV